MSNKSRLQTNNTNLQALIDKANTLPDAGSGSGGGSSTVSVTVQNMSSNPVYYWDANQSICSVDGQCTQTVDALNGVLMYAQEMMTSCDGPPNTCFYYMIRGICTALFLTDGGQMTCYSAGGGM